MSFPSALKTAPTKLFNTSNLSTVASVGIHALILGVALPGLPIFSQKENSNERLEDVGLIELTPAEQSRLPNLSQPLPLDTPTYSGVPPIDPSLFNVPNRTPSGIDPSLLPPPPNSLSFGNDLSVVSPPPSMPPLPSPPPTSYYPSPNTWTNALPAPPSSLPTPQNLPLPPQMSTPDAELRRPDFAPVRGAIDPRDLINQRNSAIAPGNLPPGYYNGMPQRTAANSEAGQRLTQLQPNPKETLQEMRIRRLVAESIEGAESLIADRANTTNEEAMRNDVNWRTKIGDAKPVEVTISGNYPRNACMRRLEGTSVYGVVVNTQGRVASSPYRPYLIKSAGYPILNQQALRDIHSNSFANQTGQPKSFLVKVNYAYNEKICPSVAVASPQPREEGVPRQTQTSQPAPTVVNPAPTKPDKAPDESEATAPTQRQPEEKTPVQITPRQESEATVPTQQLKPRLENLPPITPKEAPGASQTTEPTRQPRVEISVPTDSRKAPEGDRTNEPTSSRKVPQASEATAANNPRRNRERSSAAPTTNKKVSPIRPLGTVAPRKTSEESSNSSETSEP
jgi:hypothetical protein